MPASFLIIFSRLLIFLPRYSVSLTSFILSFFSICCLLTFSVFFLVIFNFHLPFVFCFLFPSSFSLYLSHSSSLSCFCLLSCFHVLRSITGFIFSYVYGIFSFLLCPSWILISCLFRCSCFLLSSFPTSLAPVVSSFTAAVVSLVHVSLYISLLLLVPVLSSLYLLPVLPSH